MQPLKITVELSTPMKEPGHLFHLDGLLGALRVTQAQQELGEDINPADHHYEIPVERETFSTGEWVFKASAFKLKRELPAFTWMQTGRINLATAAEHRNTGWLKLRASKPVLGGGPLKTSLYHETLVWAELTAYCKGDKAGIEKLLEGCRYIGGRRGVGAGEVKSIRVEVISEAECAWSWRFMPLAWDSASQPYATAIGALTAPYWDRTRHHPVRVPLGF